MILDSCLQKFHVDIVCGESALQMVQGEAGGEGFLKHEPEWDQFAVLSSYSHLCYEIPSSQEFLLVMEQKREWWWEWLGLDVEAEEADG